jgi:hypothetical protein
MNTDNNAPEGLDLESLAAQMLGLDTEQAQEYPEPQEQQASLPAPGHPAWQEILSVIPEELHDKVLPTLQNWDAGVSRRFQKIHDEYEPLKKFEGYDPEDIEEAMGVYRALTNDPASTWETIGRVYGLSPQQVSQATSDEDIDLDGLPEGIRERLSKIDLHDQVLEYVSKQMLELQAAEEEAQEDQALEELLGELQQAYGDFDEEYVVGLLAAGVEPDEAVNRFKTLAGKYQPQPQSQVEQQPSVRETAPRVMSSGGGIPNAGSMDVTKLSNQDTQELITQILRLSQENSS